MLPKRQRTLPKTLPKPGRRYQKETVNSKNETVNAKNETVNATVNAENETVNAKNETVNATVNAKNETVKLKEIEKVIYEAMLESKKDNGIIERIGSDKNGHWAIKRVGFFW